MGKEINVIESEYGGIKYTTDLDVPISQLIEGASNPETPREFIVNSEKEFGLEHADLDNMTIVEINSYIEELDSLWNK